MRYEHYHDEVVDCKPENWSVEPASFRLDTYRPIESRAVENIVALKTSALPLYNKPMGDPLTPRCRP